MNDPGGRGARIVYRKSFLALSAAGLATAVASTLATISGPSPFPSCPDAGPGAVANAEVEPSLAVDPRDARHIFVLYQQDRYRDGAARGIMASVSSDGGRGWQRTLLPIGVCATHQNPPPYRLSDPWVTVGPDGLVYGLASEYVLTSADDGRTWKARAVVGEAALGFFFDKGSLTADPRRGGTAYAVWARFRREANGPPTESDAMFSETKNGGRSWSRARVILRHGTHSGSIGSLIIPDPRTGELYHAAFWQVGAEPNFSQPSSLIVQRSEDGGHRWSRPVTVASAFTVALHTREAFSGKIVRTGFVVPSFALDSAHGILYAVWQDSRFAQRRYDQIVLSASSDKGRSWTPPKLVSAPGVQAFTPTIAVTRSGAIGIAYYETPSGRSRQRLKSRYRFATSVDRGRTFGHKTLASFDLSRAPLMRDVGQTNIPGGLFLGDYMGIAASGEDFRIAFVTTNETSANPTDVRYVSISARR